MGRSQRLLSLLDNGKTPILLDPRRSIFVRREAICFLDETTQAGDPDLVGPPLLEDLVRRVVHWAAPSPAKSLLNLSVRSRGGQLRGDPRSPRHRRPWRDQEGQERSCGSGAHQRTLNPARRLGLIAV